MKVTIKLTRRELVIWTAFLLATWNDRYLRGTPTDRMLHCCLSVLVHKLRLAEVLVKDKYTLKIDASDGLAFIVHCERTGEVDVADSEMAAINRIIGIIDQKTQ